jgi:hypothetical protein
MLKMESKGFTNLEKPLDPKKRWEQPSGWEFTPSEMMPRNDWNF